MHYNRAVHLLEWNAKALDKSAQTHLSLQHSAQHCMVMRGALP